MPRKSFGCLRVADIKDTPVWEFGKNGQSVTPVTRLPVDSLEGRAIGLQVTLANGSAVWAIITNVSLQSPEQNMHLMSVRLDVSGEWFDLGRYFDVDYEDRTPRHLAELMGLPLNAVFPISYDLSAIATGPDEALSGQIPATVDPQLPFEEIVQFLV